jgi:polar amino acid transport system substrate-binding protein
MPFMPSMSFMPTMRGVLPFYTLLTLLPGLLALTSAQAAAPLAHAVHAPAPILRLCVDERPQLPFITPEGKGTAGELIRMAASQSGMEVTFHGAPISRCREEIRAGVADGFATAPYTPSLLTFMSYPMDGAEPDKARAIMVARAMIFRRRGSPLEWDGRQFKNRSLPVLVPFGAAMLLDRMQSLGVPHDDKGKTLEMNFSKLAAQRGDAAVGSEYAGMALMAQARFTGQLDMLPIPFSEQPYFLGVSNTYYSTHPAAMERLWDAIGRIGRSAAYREYYQKAVDGAAR